MSAIDVSLVNDWALFLREIGFYQFILAVIGITTAGLLFKYLMILKNRLDLKYKDYDDDPQDASSGVRFSIKEGDSTKTRSSYPSDNDTGDAFAEVYMRMKNSRARLKKSVEHLKIHANVNLVLANLVIAYTLFLLFILVKDVLNIDKIIYTTLMARISVLVFSQFTVYLFIKMYRSNLTEMRFVENEITNIEQRFIALHVACVTNDSVLLKKSVGAFLQTERNFVLKKGESTLFIEREKLDKVQPHDFLERVEKVVNKIKS